MNEAKPEPLSLPLDAAVHTISMGELCLKRTFLEVHLTMMGPYIISQSHLPLFVDLSPS